MRKVKYFTLATLVTLGMSAVSQAQNQPQERQELRQENRNQRQNLREQNREQRQDLRGDSRVEQQANRPVQGTGAGQLDHLVANCILLGNQEEIAVARLAAERSKNQQVKEFAQMLVQEHEQFGKKIQPFASRDVMLEHPGTADHSDAQQRSTITRDNADRQGQTQQAQANRAGQQTPQVQTTQSGRIEHRAAYGGQGDGIGDQVFQLEQDAARECLRLTKEELMQYQGEEFDQAFLGQQIGAHIGMMAKLKAAHQHVTGELQSVLQEGYQSTQQHKQKADQLMNEIAHSGQKASRGNNNQ